MSGTNSGSNTSKMAVPQAKEAMNRFKQEVASEIGVPLKEGYNGDLTSAQAGSIGGEMVKKMIMKQEEQMKNQPSGKNPLHIFGICQRYTVDFLLQLQELCKPVIYSSKLR